MKNYELSKIDDLIYYYFRICKQLAKLAFSNYNKEVIRIKKLNEATDLFINFIEFHYDNSVPIGLHMMENTCSYIAYRQVADKNHVTIEYEGAEAFLDLCRKYLAIVELFLPTTSEVNYPYEKLHDSTIKLLKIRLII